MRLTLRTLLAYLDNTLEPQDAQALREKLAESGFATQLVQRIRDSLADASLPSPSPEAMGPVEEANVISEYLDSTLPAEQVAEIERACLESGPQLAEAAACHQILTMVLGKPAQVSPELRTRIYELPERSVDEIAAGGNFSSVNVPVEQPQLTPISDEIPTADATAPREGQPVPPVGVTDSGVSDAPTRLREAEASLETAPNDQGVAVAGARPRRSNERTRIYGGSIRPSRIAPWIVSLALIGLLMFVMAKAFEPWLENRTADRSTSSPPGLAIEPIEEEEIEVPPEQAPVMQDLAAPSADSNDASTSAAGGEDAGEPESVAILPPPGGVNDPGGVTETEPPSPSAATDSDRRAPQSSTDGAEDRTAESTSDDPVVGELATPPPAAAPEDASEAQPMEAEIASPDRVQPASTTDESDTAPSDDVASVAPPARPTTGSPDNDGSSGSQNGETSGDSVSSLPPPKPPTPADVVIPIVADAAKIVGEESLLAARVDQQWMRLEDNMVVSNDLKIVCAPTFRGNMETDQVSITLVGPTQVQWLASPAGRPTLKIDYGRILVTAVEPDVSFGLQLAEEPVQLDFADVDSIAAASVKYFRAPGFDPLIAENRLPLSGVLSVQGTIELGHNGTKQSLETGMQWVKRGETAAQVSPMESSPPWIEAADPSETTIESNARSGLLELLRDDQPLEIGLREATVFRRSEVAALAAQTLLHLGYGDVYFGVDGILSEPKQRAYWPDHYVTLLSVVDRSVESATRLKQSIEDMDDANAEPLFRLLTGYTQKQLMEGGDEELVELLNSPSMAVRVLALENLRKITGTTLYFRAEQANAVRRGPMIKKWVARLRRGDIRWPE